MMILVIILLALGVAFVFILIKNKKLEESFARIRSEAQVSVEEAQRLAEQKIVETQKEAQSAVADAQKLIDQQFAELKSESERVRQHYEVESRKIQEAAQAMVSKTIKDFEPLRKYEHLQNAEVEAQRHLTEALSQATNLRAEAESLLTQAKAAAANERMLAVQKAKELREQADALLTQATRDAGRIVADAEKRVEQTAGDAFNALRDKQLLERAAQAMRNVVDGYGDRYVIPTRSLLDELAVEFGYTAAGESLKLARAQSRRMIEQGEAAVCDYVEASRRETAIRFVIDAFNGRVDAILSRSRNDNLGTLEQEIHDAFSLVNLNGDAFRNARILPIYLEARLAELKWAVVVHELALKQKEEQRYLKERMRDEEKARREIEQKMREAARDKELQRAAVEEAQKQYDQANAEMKAHYEQKLAEAQKNLMDATTRALTVSQMYKKGHVYILSNIGSFGEGVYKIGQTRRPDPQERVDELGSASVPFEFDVHAFIITENAPMLEHKLHKQFLMNQVNKMNSRKEFFRVGLSEIFDVVEKLKVGEDFTIKLWTDKAAATQYKDSLAIENNPDEKAKWLEKQKALANIQLKRDASKLPTVDELEVIGES